ncbi:Uncharacterised nucleotidyltransferase [bacterium JGI 053]|nr:Uncharacterised nucleotidyltransferase [bacterium JGI 053]
MSGRAALREAAGGALRLRAWALPLLAGAPPSLPPAVGAQAWSVFLAIERCALPLRDALAAVDLLEEADEAARSALGARAVNEAMHVLALRREAADVAALLRRHGWEGVVLKGGATVLGGGRELDVQDLDLLLPPGEARALAAVLDQAGYERHEADLPPGAPNRHQLAARMRPGGMTVEVHVDLAPLGQAVDLDADTLPLPVAGLRRLRSTAHLWHVLTHGTLHHPERRGALRDLLVAASAAGWCTPAELAEVERRVAAHGRGEVLGRMLAMARGLAAGAAVDDRFAREAATAYLLYAFTARHRPPTALLLALGRTAHSLASGAGEYGRLWVGTHVSAFSRGYVGERRIDRVLPGLGYAGRSLWRAANLAAAAVPGAWLAGTARALARGR